MADDPYDVLGVARNASAQQVSEAYRALAQIYHPDRYSEAPPRVQEEAQRRMQALNAAYAQLGKPSAGAAGTRPGSRRGQPRQKPPREPAPTATPPRASRTRLQAVLYVDGSKHYHDPAVAPLGLDLRADPVRPAIHERQCPTLDGELSRWFQGQSRNASMADKLMYAAWDEEQRALYTATIGCSEVLLSSVASFAVACAECTPPAPPR